MTPHRMLLELEALAERLGIAIRTEPFDRGALGTRGGLCRVHGKPVIVVDSTLPAADKIAIVASALGRFDVDAVYLSPLLRARIEASRTGRPPVRPAPRRAMLPGLARTRPRP